MSLTYRQFIELGLDFIPGQTWIDTFSNIFMVGRPRPIFNSLDELVLNGITMNVIDVPLQVCRIANLMLPKPALPDATLTLMFT